MDFINLFIGYNKEENFRILICAFDEIEAQGKADEYLFDSNLNGHFEVEQVEGDISNIHFDCDYVIA